MHRGDFSGCLYNAFGTLVCPEAFVDEAPHFVIDAETVKDAIGFPSGAIACSGVSLPAAKQEVSKDGRTCTYALGTQGQKHTDVCLLVRVDQPLTETLHVPSVGTDLIPLAPGFAELRLPFRKGKLTLDRTAIDAELAKVRYGGKVLWNDPPRIYALVDLSTMSSRTGIVVCS